MENRGSFASRFGVIAAMAGSAVGLGNIWKFPYMVGENGGSAFIITYLIISVLITAPVLIAEMSLGRMGGQNVLGTFRTLAPKQKAWQGVGWLGLITAFVILSFYSVIAGWSLAFIKESVVGGFMGKSVTEVTADFNGFIASGWQPVAWAIVFLVMTCLIAGSGLQKGIERSSKLLMPLLAVLLVVLVVRSFFLGGFGESVQFLVKPDFSKITPEVMVAALGQSFFSLSVGMGTMLTYGSYVKKSENITGVVTNVLIADVAIAILAGFAIFPAVFTFDINPTSGPDLVFLTLPSLFAQIGGGQIMSILFFVLLFFAALTSAFSLLEVVVAYVTEELKLKRRSAVIVSFVGLAILATLCAMSQMPDSALRLGSLNLFDAFDKVSSNVMLPLGGLLIVLFWAWKLPKQRVQEEITNNGTCSGRIFPVLYFLLRYIVPVALVIMFINLNF